MTDPQNHTRQHDGEPAPLTPVGKQDAPFNVVATFIDAAAARNAIEALERAGIDGDDIALHGVETTADPDAVDDSTNVGPVSRTAIVAAVGGLLGSILGAFVGVVLLSSVMGAAAAVVGAIFLGGVGAVLAGATVTGLGGAWHDTFLDLREGSVSVGVHTARSDVADTALSVLESTDTLSLQSYRR